MFEKLTSRIFKDEIRRQVRATLAAAAADTDSTFFIGTKTVSDLYRDRLDWDRQTIIEESLRAWRISPVARRIVALTTQFVIGGGVKWTCDHRATSNFLHEFWTNRINQIEVQLREWCDELTRAGDLFLLISVDDAGMSYIRAVPSEQIKEIQSPSNDYRQEQAFIQTDLNASPYPGYDPNDPEQKLFMLHYLINRPVGSQWGESDMAPLLKWIGRQSSWLEDRARLNRFRNAFLWIVKKKWASEAEKSKRQSELTVNPPAPGSILVADLDETWEAPSPKLESPDAEKDGLALKKQIAIGAGSPLHFLAEPESSTRTTAEAAGTPTYRHYEQRQILFLWLLKDLLTVVTTVRKRYDRRVNPKATIEVRGADISERDNAGLSLAASHVVSAFGDLFDRGLIDEKEFMRLVYRFVGEFLGESQIIPQGLRRQLQPIKQPGTGASIETDTGDVKLPPEAQLSDSEVSDSEVSRLRE